MLEKSEYYGVLILKTRYSKSKFPDFFFKPSRLISKKGTSRVIEGNAFSHVLKTEETPLVEGDFILISNDSEQPAVIDVPSKNKTMMCCFDGSVSNIQQISESTGYNQLEFSKPSFVPLKLSIGYTSSNTDIGEESVVEQLYRKIVLPIKGDFSFTALHLGTKSRFLIARSDLKQPLYMYIVFFDGVYALIWANNVKCIDTIIDTIKETSFIPRLFFLPVNLLEGKLMYVIHPYYLIRKFQGWVRTYSSFSDSILVISALVRYITSAAIESPAKNKGEV